MNWFIANGQLQPDEMLPSVHKAANHHSINFNTVRNAYQKLEAEGLVETRQGLGTRIFSYDPERLAQLACSLPSHTEGLKIHPLRYLPFHICRPLAL